MQGELVFKRQKKAVAHVDRGSLSRFRERVIIFRGLLTSRFIGCLEGVVDGRVRGWIVDRSDAHARVVVRHGQSRKVNWQVVADLYRADVQKKGLSADGFCGFSLPIAFEATMFVQLSPMHRVKRVEAAEPIPCRTIRSGSLFWYSNRHNGVTAGFAVNLDEPSRRLRLRLDEANGSSKFYVACRFDARSNLMPEHDGFHGFRIRSSACPARLTEDTTGALIASWSR